MTLLMTTPALTPARNAFDRLVRVETMLWNRCDDELKRRRCLRLGRLEVLRVVADVERCRVNDIASRLQITVGATSKLVDRLEASGHCQRRPNPEDRRSSVIFVTDLGKRALAEAEDVLEPLLQRCLAAADIDHLNNALVRVEETLRQVVGSVPGASGNE